MTKLIFLDIDGVLNHQIFYTTKSQAQRYKEEGHPLCELDAEKVGLLIYYLVSFYMNGVYLEVVCL